MTKYYLIFAVLIGVIFISVVNAQEAALTVKISRIKAPKGLISVGLYKDEKGFPDKGMEYMGKEIQAAGPTVVYMFQNIPFGTYAIAVYHDANANGRLDSNFLGIPKEEYAFSNNAVGAFGMPPSFKNASFRHTGNQTVSIKMDE